jgi:iron only hydrogenase large subunit-like protein
MQSCPTEAIRVKEGLAIINASRCIDCSQCIESCPFDAHSIDSGSLEDIKNFKYTIVIPAITFAAQFSGGLKIDVLCSALRKLGFDLVFSEGLAIDYLKDRVREIVVNNQVKKPIISSHCPAVIRLIQTKYSSLIDHIMPTGSPVDIAANMARNLIKEKHGYSDSDIGVFYLSPCPARITNVVNPIGMQESAINLTIPIKDVYGDVLRILSGMKESVSEFSNCMKPENLPWAEVGGQAKMSGVDNYIAVSGIHEVAKVFDQIEMGELDDVDFIEASSCTGGCVGGPLNIENPFVAQRNIRKLAENSSQGYFQMIDSVLAQFKHIYLTEEISPKQTNILDEDFTKAIEKMKQIEEITSRLRGLDCGSCGAPSCRALAEDIVQGKARMEDCVFYQEQQHLWRLEDESE